MVFWNYRIIKTTQEGKVTYRIHEVYYDVMEKLKDGQQSLYYLLKHIFISGWGYRSFSPRKGTY